MAQIRCQLIDFRELDVLSPPHLDLCWRPGAERDASLRSKCADPIDRLSIPASARSEMEVAICGCPALLDIRAREDSFSPITIQDLQNGRRIVLYEITGFALGA